MERATGLILKVAGGGTQFQEDAPADAVGLLPVDLWVDGQGNLWIVDWGWPPGLRRVDAQSGKIRTVAGGDTPFGRLGDGGPALGAFLFNPRGLALDRSGNLYIADTDNRRVRVVRGPIP